MNPTLILTGLPGSGKTASPKRSRRISTRLSSAVTGSWLVCASFRQSGTPGGVGHVAFRSVGWSALWNLAIVQLREGRSVIQDGVAHAPEVQRSRDVAGQAKCLRGIVLHREPVIGRTRNIADWPERTWEEVEHFRSVPGAAIRVPVPVSPQLVLNQSSEDR